MRKVVNIFISYSRQDLARVKDLCQKLERAGFKPWLDQKDILPGESWKQAIQRAIQSTDLFIACFSKNSINRKGMIQREIKQALDILQEKLSTDIYVIPARLEKCDLPEELKHLQWVDLFENDGVARLITAIKKQVNVLEKDSMKDISKQVRAHTRCAANQPRITWPPGQLTPESLLMDAKSSLLLVGTSLNRAMEAEIFIYRQWLDANPERKIGLLFLNPNSPHSSGRSRPNVRRSNSATIASSLDLAYRENRQRKRFLPAIYEGPYRYTARASDLGQSMDEGESKINIVTSSRTSGTTMGFQVSLSSETSQRAYEFYESELLDLWKTALTNPPGHGISLVYRSDIQIDPNTIQSAVGEFMKGLGKENYSLHTYSSEQYHITLSSICRTQSQSFLPALRISASESEECLPKHFGDYLLEFIQIVCKFFKRNVWLDFDKLTLDETGQIWLESEKYFQGDFIQSINDLREKKADLLSKYNNLYPNEPWSALVNLNSEHRFAPRITIGVVFDHAHGLPTRMEGRIYSMRLPNSLKLNCGAPLLVHYAYPSLLRCVGEFTIPSTENPCLYGEIILKKLEIDSEF